MKNLTEQENLLKGKIIFNIINNEFELDEEGKRIEYLISNYLVRINSDYSGWFVLYQDPNDNRLWELSYPDSEEEGGGAPMLRVIGIDSIEMGKYQV